MKKRGKFREYIKSYFSNRELNTLYTHSFLRNLGTSLVGLFIPVYLLTLGFNLVDISLFYIVYFAAILAIMPLAMFCLSKIGVKKIMILGTLLLVGYYYSLQFLGSGLPYYFAAFLFGLSETLYFAAFNIEFASFMDNKKGGRQISFSNSLGILASIICPIIGGFLIYLNSFKFTFLSAAVLLFLSAIPLAFSKDFKIPNEKYSVKKIIRQAPFRHGLAFQVAAILGLVGGIFWPIFIYLNLKNVIPLGIISSITAFIMMFFTLYIGNQADKNPEKTLTTGVLFNSPSWIARIFLLSPSGLLFMNLYSDFTSTFISVPFQKFIFENAKKNKSKRDYFLFRELHLSIGRVGILLLVILIGNLFWIFLASFFITFGYLFLIKLSSRIKNGKK